MKRTLFPLLVAAILTACVSAYGTPSRPTPIPFITPPTLSPTPGAATDAPAPTATPSAAAPPPAAAAAAAPAMRRQSFPLIAVGRGNVSGVVQVTERDGAFTATVSAQGLPAGAPTLHTVHIHLGSCADAYSGMHLTVLGLLSANAAGAGTLTAPLASVYVSPGHYVIVYASISPQVIVACANLAALS